MSQEPLWRERCNLLLNGTQRALASGTPRAYAANTGVAPAMSAPEGIVLQKSKIERRRKSRKSCFLADTATAILRSADTKLRGRFCVKRCGPLISPHAKRISGSKNFRSSPQKDFFNTIEGKADLGAALLAVRDRSRAAVANSMDTPRFRPIDLPRYRTYYPGLERPK